MPEKIDDSASGLPARLPSLGHDLVYFRPPGTLTPTDRTQRVARVIRIVEVSFKQLVIENDQLRGTEMSDGSVVARDAVFVRPRFRSDDPAC